MQEQEDLKLNGHGEDTKRNINGINRQFVDVLGWVILVAWAISFAVNLFNSKYNPNPVIHALMMLVATASFTTNLIRKK